MSFVPLKTWPVVSRDAAEIALLDAALPIGNDLEWNADDRPTILGLSDGNKTISVSYSEGRDYLKALAEKKPIFVGHNFISADLFVLEEEGIKIELDQIEDTIIWWWLTHMHLCKASNKASLEEDAGEKRGPGFMNLGTMLSVTTNLPYYKTCRDAACSGPCPDHDVFGYNGVDAYGPLEALPKLKKIARLRGVDHLYPLHRQVAYHLAQMNRHGVLIDVPYVTKLQSEFVAGKLQLASSLAFNPNAPKQVKEFFAAQGVELENAQEQTIREAVEDHPQNVELANLLEYKEMGNGTDRWFAIRVKDKKGNWVGFLWPDGRVRPHTGFFTSSGRLQCASPNLQNVAKRRIDRKTGESIGKRIRRAIIAPEGYYLGRADYSNGENRIFLYLAGYKDIANDRTKDFHNEMTIRMKLTDEDEFAKQMGGAREASKSITHSSDYAEGLKLMERRELFSGKAKKEIDYGARIVFPDWTFNNKIVSFTGINLANRAYGSATWENRRKALQATEKYFATYPGIRDLQRFITRQIEKDKVVRPPHKYALLSYGPDEDRIKTALAVYGSQPIAHWTKLAIVRAFQHQYYREGKWFCILQVHDELIFEVKQEVDYKDFARQVRLTMEFETPEMPGLVIPAEPSVGIPTENEPSNWRDQTKLSSI